MCEIKVEWIRCSPLFISCSCADWDDYISSGGGAGPVLKSWKIKPKLGGGYRVSMGRTWFLYKNRK